MQYGLQMYTLRQLTEKHMAQTLEQVAAMGYTGIELAGFGDLTPEQMMQTVRDNGLTVISAHVGYQELQADAAKWIEIAKNLGMARITLPWMDPEKLGADQIKATADMINEIQQTLAEAGMELSYHNHDFEFVDGRYERLMELCPQLKFELDTYWVKFAGYDPAQLMEKYADKIVLVHLKDMLDKNPVTHEDPNPTLMTGTVDVTSIVRQGDKMEIPWGIVEMDRPIGDPLEAVRVSLENLRREIR